MVITISRKYATGGHSIAAGLSEKLGLAYYDRDFVKLTAKVSGYSEDDIRREGEDMSRRAKWMNQFLDNMASYISSYDRIFEAQREVILELAKNPCILVGRCANIILKEAGIPSFDIFLYADHEFQLKRTRELEEYGDMDPEKYLDRRDHLREVYYRTYTGHDMGDYRDYNICLDTGAIGLDKSVDILVDILKK